MHVLYFYGQLIKGDYFAQQTYDHAVFAGMIITQLFSVSY